MILLKQLIDDKLINEFKSTVQGLEAQLNNKELATDFDNYFNFFSDRGDWTPQDPIIGINNRPATITLGLDVNGKPFTRKKYPVAIIITDAFNGKWQKSADVDAYTMRYNWTAYAEDYDYDDIVLIMNEHSNIYNQSRDDTTFAAEDYSSTHSFDIPSFGSIQNMWGRQAFSMFMPFNILFIKDGVVGNDIVLSIDFDDDGGFMPLNQLTYSMGRAKLGDGNTFQGDKQAKMLNNTQTLSFTAGIIYTKSTVGIRIVREILENGFLSKVYTLRYNDPNFTDIDFEVFASDLDFNGDQGEFAGVSITFVLAKELS